jgi:hydrogenase nickel incorporation protein HypA/HybF
VHELPVVNSLVQQLQAEVERLGVAGRVEVVHLKLGALTTFVAEAMTFYFDALTKGTALESARLEVEEVPVAGRCRACGEALTIEGLPFICAACGSPELEITSGRELLIDSLEVRDETG